VQDVKGAREPRLPRLCLAAVLLLAAVLRLYQLGEVPAGLFCDEAALGFNAHCIATGGIDENGNRFPLFFWSFAVSYKNPIYVYAAAIPVKLFGLSEWSLRLTSVLFGVGTIFAIYRLGAVLVDAWVGVCAAFFLAVMPWHLHFSRLGFELIAFPFLFIIGFTFLVRFTQGRRTLWTAMLFMGLCPYAYAIANLFVPLFLLGFALLYLPSLLRRWPETWRALVVAIVTVAPAGIFYFRHEQLSTQYFRRTAVVVNEANGIAGLVGRWTSNYLTFFSPDFLVHSGDPLVRHAVRGFGELLPIMVPLALIGAAVVLLNRDRCSKLLVWWLALYPLGASLMNEIPSASRGFIGAPAFALLAGIGLRAMLGWVERVSVRRPLVAGIQIAVLAAVACVTVTELYPYLWAYFIDYPKYSAARNDGFQYGYRDTIRYMESQRPNYDRLLLTANDVNHPDIFPLFYNHPDPWWWAKGPRTSKELGYWVLDPAEYARYSMDERNLFQLRPWELSFFDDYEIKHEVVAPDGEVAWVIADVRARKRFLTDWLVLGLFDNANGDGVQRDFIDVGHFTRNRQSGSFGDIYWRPFVTDFVRVDLNSFFATGDPRNPQNPEYVCAYAAQTLRSTARQSGLLELIGTDDMMQVWLNGRMLAGPLLLNQVGQLVPIDLNAGANLLVLKSCERIGYWYFTARVTDYQGHDLPGITTSAEVPFDLPVAHVGAQTAPQLVEGFTEVEHFTHADSAYPDYRGSAQSWVTKVTDSLGEVVWRTAPCPAKQRTIFAFATTLSNEAGEAAIYVNGDWALSFQMDREQKARRWTRGQYELTFIPRKDIGGNSGIMLLDVPADQITAGQPVELRIMPLRGDHASWFRLQGHPDTVAHEQLTVEQVMRLIEQAEAR
jgi:4-amino-4-deoxy-L-arabinose transferase-like glycosyltransferase